MDVVSVRRWPHKYKMAHLNQFICFKFQARSDLTLTMWRWGAKMTYIFEIHRYMMRCSAHVFTSKSDKFETSKRKIQQEKIETCQSENTIVSSLWQWNCVCLFSRVKHICQRFQLKLSYSIRKRWCVNRSRSLKSMCILFLFSSRRRVTVYYFLFHCSSVHAIEIHLQLKNDWYCLRDESHSVDKNSLNSSSAWSYWSFFNQHQWNWARTHMCARDALSTTIFCIFHFVFTCRLRLYLSMETSIYSSFRIRFNALEMHLQWRLTRRNRFSFLLDKIWS